MSESAALVAVAEVLLANSPAGIVVYDGASGRCVVANPAVAAIVGGSVEAMRKQDFRTITSWRDAGLHDVAEATLRDGTPRRREATMRTTFGKTVCLDCFVSRFDIDGRPHMMIIVSDVTERNTAEQALVVRERELRTLVEAFPDLVVRYDRALRRTYVNPAWERASGVPAAEALGVRADAAAEVPSPSHAGYLAALRDVLESGVPRRVELSLANARGEALYLEYVLVPEHDRAGSIVGVLAVGHDLSERRRAEEEVRRLNQELERRVRDRTADLEAANRDLEAFAYSISHDLRAPLRHVIGFIGLLQRHADAALDDKARHYTGTIASAAGALSSMIDDLLSFSRLGRAEMTRAQVDVAALVRGVVRELGPEAEGRAVEWRIGRLPPVFADGRMLRLALTNLVSNALKFTRRQARAEIEIGSAPGGEGAAETVLFVRDNGVGFDPRYADRLFKVFQRLHRAEDFEGTGVGLANVRRIVERHGGRVWAESAPGGGATFYLALPAPPAAGGG